MRGHSVTWSKKNKRVNIEGGGRTGCRRWTWVIKENTKLNVFLILTVPGTVWFGWQLSA